MYAWCCTVIYVSGIHVTHLCISWFICKSFKLSSCPVQVVSVCVCWCVHVWCVSECIHRLKRHWINTFPFQRWKNQLSCHLHTMQRHCWWHTTGLYVWEVWNVSQFKWKHYMILGQALIKRTCIYSTVQIYSAGHRESTKPSFSKISPQQNMLLEWKLHF